jgi:hypothetical protein
MAKYLILIYGDEQQWENSSPEETNRIHQGHASLMGSAGDKVLGGHQLHPSAMATTLRAGTNGRPEVTDGPFLETKEGIGGYYLIEAADLDGAVAWAGQLPEVSADHSGVEIRPVMEMS